MIKKPHVIAGAAGLGAVGAAAALKNKAKLKKMLKKK